MTCYRQLAYVYDQLSADYDYAQWVECTLRLFRHYHPNEMPGARVLDLGCGTGRAALEFLRRGYHVTGVDVSPEMLSVAEERLAAVCKPPLLICQDLRTLNMGSARFHLATALCDTFNYIVNLSELTTTFQRVHHVLAPGGVLVCDFNTRYKLATVYGDNTYIDEDDGCFVTWENHWDEDERRCDMELNIFLEGTHGWQRSTELHTEKAYEPEEVLAALQTAGFTRLLGPLAAFDLTPPHECTERVFYAAQKAS